MNLKPVVLQPPAFAGVASGKTIVSQRMQRESSVNRTLAEKSTVVICTGDRIYSYQILKYKFKNSAQLVVAVLINTILFFFCRGVA